MIALLNSLSRLLIYPSYFVGDFSKLNRPQREIEVGAKKIALFELAKPNSDDRRITIGIETLQNGNGS